MRIYNRALSANELQTDMNTPIGAPALPTRPADRPDGLHRDRGVAEPGQPRLDGLDGQRRRHRLPGRALPGRDLHDLRPSRDSDRYHLQRPGLSAATTYRYRVRAADAAGNFSGYTAIQNATTPDTQAPTDSDRAERDGGLRESDQSLWSTSTDNVAVTGYRVERCQGATCTTFVQVATPTGTTYNDAGLTTATTYRYRVRAADAAGNLSGYTAIQNAATPDTTPPTAPTGLSATAASGTQINLAWTASTDNVAVTGYRVERCQGATCTTFVQVATPTGTTYNDIGLTTATTYRYRVRAADAAGNFSGYTAIQNATTPDTQAPTDPTGLSATAVSPSQINLSWTAATDNVAVTGYRVERCQGATCTTFVQARDPDRHHVQRHRLTTATTYRYRVRAADAAGNLSGYSAIQNAATTDTQPPTDPTGLSATAVSGTQIDLAWTGSSDNVAVANYRVERCQGATCTTFVQVATPTGTTYNDIGLTTATTYRYRVRAADAAGNLSGYTAIQSATTPDTQAPTAPTGLTATAGLPEPDRPRLDGVDGQRRARGLPGRALPGRGVYELRPGGDPDSGELQRRRPLGGDDVPLPRARRRRCRQPERLHGDPECDDAGHAGADGAVGLGGDGGVGEPDQPWLGGVDGQHRRDRLPGGALPGCGLFELRPGRDDAGCRVERHRFAGGDQLQLPGAGGGCGRKPERLLERAERDHAGGRTLLALLVRLAHWHGARRCLDGGRRHLLEPDGYPNGRQHHRPQRRVLAPDRRCEQCIDCAGVAVGHGVECRRHRFAVRLASLPTATSNLAYIDSGTDLLFRYDASSQRLQLVLGTSTATSATTVSAATWYMIDLRYDLSGNLHLGDWRVDGVDADASLSKRNAGDRHRVRNGRHRKRERLHRKLRRHPRRSAAGRIPPGG